MPELTREVLDQLRHCSIALKRALYAPVDDIVSRWAAVVTEFAALDSALGGGYYDRGEELLAEGNGITAPIVSVMMPLDRAFVALFANFSQTRVCLAWVANFVSAADQTADAVNSIRSIAGEGDYSD